MLTFLLRLLTRCHSAAPLRTFGIGLATLLAITLGSLLAPGVASAQPPGVQIGFCPGPGGVVTVTIEVVVRCPAQTTLTATIMAPCDDAAAVMSAVDGAMATFMIGGTPIFGPPIVVGGGVSGQTRHEYLLTPGFLTSNCIIQSVDLDFDCGTMGLVVRVPAMPGGGDTPHGPTKLAFLSPPPGPGTLLIKFEGCAAIGVTLDGTETADEARDKVLAALLTAGYDAHVDVDGRIVVDGDCSGLFPTGTDEFGLAGGAPMHLRLGTCPPPEPTGTSHRSWGSLKTLYR